MGDLDCGDCNCNGCDCDCNCDCCCIEDCCSGENNVILCCCLFPSSNDNARRTNRGVSTYTDTHTDCSLCCCCCTSPSPRSNESKKKRSKCFCSRLWSWCIGSTSKPSPPSSPPRAQSSSDNLSPAPVENTERRTGKQASWEGLNSSSKDYKMDGKWSRPERYGDHYQRQFQ
ncbi:uncharacterized protein LOC110689655 [Chenopodium quinoa]|uniref:uncharacterized protein LOC110689655 n=1 Tax=Chenopodium quinoa TaxID=63459 RepID=UPI000B7993D7|nr:uncharacterized protein LOC110689655 [Chenopodium quinoa]